MNRIAACGNYGNKLGRAMHLMIQGYMLDAKGFK